MNRIALAIILVMPLQTNAQSDGVVPSQKVHFDPESQNEEGAFYVMGVVEWLTVGEDEGSKVEILVLRGLNGVTYRLGPPGGPYGPLDSQLQDALGRPVRVLGYQERPENRESFFNVHDLRLLPDVTEEEWVDIVKQSKWQAALEAVNDQAYLDRIKSKAQIAELEARIRTLDGRDCVGQTVRVNRKDYLSVGRDELAGAEKGAIKAAYEGYMKVDAIEQCSKKGRCSDAERIGEQSLGVERHTFYSSISNTISTIGYHVTASALYKCL